VAQLKANPAANDLVAILNTLEGLALYFVHGAADEVVAYPVIGPLFCEDVEMLAPLLIHLRNKLAGVASGQFANTIKLYETWSVRTRQTELKERQANIGALLSALPADKKIPPIGI
jgi:hypothetical protein